MSLRRPVLSILLLLSLVRPAVAQTGRGQTDSVVVLMNASKLELLEDRRGHYRKAIDARFLHNNTYLVCDSAMWNVDQRVINAYGNVRILQEQTVLSSDRLDYLIDEDLAQFRGTQVQLLDKDGNTLRTRYLDYNTKDSVAVFERGGSMRDKDGQVIESTDGTYDSKEKLFTFSRNVNMYTDSVYVKTSRLYYHTDYDFAEFYGKLDAWKDRNMISSESGTYDRTNERFFFTGDVHIMSDTQEGWSDSLYFNRLSNDVEMFGNVQVTDTTRNVSALSERLFYSDSLSRVTLERNATVIARTEEGDQIDTVYMGADRMVYWTEAMCDIDGNIVAAAQKRLSDLESDPVSAYRRKAAEEAAQAAAAASEQSGGPQMPGGMPESSSMSENAAGVDLEQLKIDPSELAPEEENIETEEDDSEIENVDDGADVPEAEAETLDSAALAEKVRLDSIVAAEKFRLDSIALADSLAVVRAQEIRDSLASRDTSRIGFLTATGSVKMYRSDMQALCDSLSYTDLDSLARMFLEPRVWNEGNRQYSADSLTVAIKNQRMDKANLMSNAFIIIQEDSICFDQIKGAEIMAYFDTTTALKRFDALGGANALFFLKENDAFATVNKVESKMLSAVFVDGEIDRIYYFDNPKNDAYPVVQLPKEERELKGFNWQPQFRPEGKEDITTLDLRTSQRITYLARPMPSFTQTERYFPGHMDSIKKMLAWQDSLSRARHAEQRRLQEIARREAELQEMALADSLAAEVPEGNAEDVPGEADDHAGDETPVTVSDHGPAPVDTLSSGQVVEAELSPEEIKARADSLKAAQKAEEKARKKAEAEAKRQARKDAKEARWALLDARDAARAAEKEARALEKQRQRTLKAVIAAEKQAEKDRRKLERYVQKYEKKKARQEERNARKTK